MDRTKYYSGMQPTLEDIEFEQLSKEEAVLNRMKDLFTDGVLSGLKVYIDEDDTVKVKSGIAYILGERTLLLDDTIVLEEIPDGTGYFYIKFVKQDWMPQSHFISGEEHNIRVSDSSELLFKAEDVKEEDEAFLAMIVDGIIYDKRQFVELKLTTPDMVEPVDKLVVMTGFEQDISYTPNMS